jgi:hypothetical protein
MVKKRAKYLGIVLGAWDTAWKVVAIRRAVKNRQWRWVLPLATVNSVGILPMLYLARWANTVEEPGESEVENRY